jgi:inorganic phosphate transporter, PiT family
MVDPFYLLIAVILLTLAFDYVNGFHDTANAIATVVSTNVMPPRTAVLLAAAFNFLGAFLGTGVAKTIGGDIADPNSITQTVVLSALVGAITWNLITWYFGIPSSSSHALVGGIVGAVLAHGVVDEGTAFGAQLSTLMTSKGVVKVLKGLVISPLAGFLVGFAIMVLLLWIVRRRSPTRVTKWFRRLQLLSASAMALSHGSNDAQKAMGIVAMALVAYYSKHRESVPVWVELAAWEGPKKELVIPVWVIIACASAMAAGTAAGGWRIMKTMGHKIIKLRPINGFAAETAGAIVILAASHLHAPVSTTHVISSSIMGVGSTQGVSAVRWGIAGNIIVAWVLTIPISALVAMLCYMLLRVPFGA